MTWKISAMLATMPRLLLPADVICA